MKFGNSLDRPPPAQNSARAGTTPCANSLIAKAQVHLDSIVISSFYVTVTTDYTANPISQLITNKPAFHHWHIMARW